jgi:hypothetical protein
MLLRWGMNIYIADEGQGYEKVYVEVCCLGSLESVRFLCLISYRIGLSVFSARSNSMWSFVSCVNIIGGV